MFNATSDIKDVLPIKCRAELLLKYGVGVERTV